MCDTACIFLRHSIYCLRQSKRDPRLVAGVPTSNREGTDTPDAAPAPSAFANATLSQRAAEVYKMIKRDFVSRQPAHMRAAAADQEGEEGKESESQRSRRAGLIGRSRVLQHDDPLAARLPDPAPSIKAAASGKQGKPGSAGGAPSFWDVPHHTGLRDTMAMFMEPISDGTPLLSALDGVLAATMPIESEEEDEGEMGNEGDGVDVADTAAMLQSLSMQPPAVPHAAGHGGGGGGGGGGRAAAVGVPLSVADGASESADGGIAGTMGVGIVIQQPEASLTVHGLRRFHGAAWPTQHRGRIWLISGDDVPTGGDIAVKLVHYATLQGDCTPPQPTQFRSNAVIGCADLVDVLSREEYEQRGPDGAAESPEGEAPWLWRLENCKRLAPPVAFPCHLSSICTLVSVPEDMAKQAARDVEEVNLSWRPAHFIVRTDHKHAISHRNMGTRCTVHARK